MALKLRLIGDTNDIRAVLQNLHDSPGLRVVDTSGERPTRYGEGSRVYAVVEVDGTQHAEETTTAEETPPTRPRLRQPRALGDGKPARRRR